MLTGKLGREDLTLQGALAKAAGDQDARGVAQNLGDILLVELSPSTSWTSTWRS